MTVDCLKVPIQCVFGLRSRALAAQPLGFGQVGRPPVLVMMSGYSRVITARMLPLRQSPDLLGGHSALIGGLGRVPRALVLDNESAVGQWRGGRPQR